jgi:hypothetical protein
VDAVLNSLLVRQSIDPEADRDKQRDRSLTVKKCKIRGSCTNIVAVVGGSGEEAAAAVDAVLSSLLQGPMNDPEADRDDLHESN